MWIRNRVGDRFKEEHEELGEEERTLHNSIYIVQAICKTKKQFRFNSCHWSEQEIHKCQMMARLSSALCCECLGFVWLSIGQKTLEDGAARGLDPHRRRWSDALGDKHVSKHSSAEH